MLCVLLFSSFIYHLSLAWIVIIVALVVQVRASTMRIENLKLYLQLYCHAADLRPRFCYTRPGSFPFMDADPPMFTD